MIMSKDECSTTSHKGFLTLYVKTSTKKTSGLRSQVECVAAMNSTSTASSSLDHLTTSERIDCQLLKARIVGKICLSHKRSFMSLMTCIYACTKVAQCWTHAPQLSSCFRTRLPTATTSRQTAESTDFCNVDRCSKSLCHSSTTQHFCSARKRYGCRITFQGHREISFASWSATVVDYA